MKPRIEPYSLATVQQITAVGPQDTYLTKNAWKYLPNYYYSDYPSCRSSWNNFVTTSNSNKPKLKKDFDWYYPYSSY